MYALAKEKLLKSDASNLLHHCNLPARKLASARSASDFMMGRLAPSFLQSLRAALDFVTTSTNLKLMSESLVYMPCGRCWHKAFPEESRFHINAISSVVCDVSHRDL